MRKLIYIICVLLVCSSCGEDEDLEPTNNNIPPSQPSLITPSNNSTIVTYGIDDPIYFEWTSVTDPDDDFQTYRFYIADNPSLINASFLGSSNNFISLNDENNTSPTLTLYPNVEYFWYVEARDLNGNISASQLWSFNLEDGLAPSIPQLVFPLNETECSNDFLTFQWDTSTEPSGGNIDYKLYISSSPSLDNNVDVYETSNTFYDVSLPLGTALYWRVEAISTNGNNSFSETRSLYTQGLGSSNTIPQLVYTYPEDDAVISDQSPSLQWQASDSETSNNNLNFKVYFSEVGQDLLLIYEDADITSYELTGLDIGTSYQWSIWVSDEDGATNVGEVYTFTVN